MAGPNGTDDFASIIAKSQQMPDMVNDQGKDLPDGFPMASSPNHRVIDSSKDPTGIEGAVKYDFTCHRGVFMVYRPWEHCTRCASDMANNVVAVPTTGDYTCPHTQLDSYQAIMNKALAGEFLAASENEIVQKDGSIVVSLKWLEKKVNLSRKKKSAIAPTQPPNMQREEDDL